MGDRARAGFDEGDACHAVLDRRMGDLCGSRLSGLPRRRESALSVFDLDDSDRAEGSAPDHRPRLSDHRVADVVVSENKERVPLRRGRGLRELFRLGERRGPGLVADDVDAALRNSFAAGRACGSA